MKVIVGSKIDYESEFSILGKDINDILVEHLKDLNLAKPTSRNKMQKRTSVFSVSQCSYDCYRKIYFDMVEPVGADESSIGRFTMGDLIDELLKQALKKHGARVDVGCGKNYFNDEIRIQGNNDAEFSDLIVEVKSVSPFAWKYIVGGKDKLGNVIVGQPKIQHVRQLNTYMDARNIRKGVILYVNKDDLKTKPYFFDYDESLMVQTVGRCVTVWRSILSDTVPSKIRGSECSFCGHKESCKKYS